MKKKELIILTGPNGAGISSAKFVYEEAGYFITDNPPFDSIKAVLDAFVNLEIGTGKFVLLVNIVKAKEIIELVKTYKEFDARLILLMASKETILSRFALSRHVHPRSVFERCSLETAIDEDLLDAKSLTGIADFSLDTSSLTVKELRRSLYAELDGEQEEKSHVTFMSFGIKNGMPMGLDMMLDVRALPNPFWVDELRELTGEDQPVIDYLMSFPETQTLLDELVRFLEFQLGQVKKTGRVSYNVGVCCSGGQHRSLFVSNYLANHFKNDYQVRVLHRDNPKGE